MDPRPWVGVKGDWPKHATIKLRVPRMLLEVCFNGIRAKVEGNKYYITLWLVLPRNWQAVAVLERKLLTLNVHPWYVIRRCIGTTGAKVEGSRTCAPLTLLF